MTDAVREVWQQLELAWSGEVSIGDFEQWVYRSDALEPALGAAHAFALQAFDYTQDYADHELRKVVDTIYAELRPWELARDTARRIAIAYLAGELDLWSTAAVLGKLRSTGARSWIPTEFVYIDSEADAFPHPEQFALWDPKALARRQEESAPQLEALERRAQMAARELLVTLDSSAPEA